MAAVQTSELLSWEEMKCDLDRALCQDEFGPTTALTEERFLEREKELSQGDDGMIDAGKRQHTWESTICCL